MADRARPRPRAMRFRPGREPEAASLYKVPAGSESLFATMAKAIGKVTIQSEHSVLHQRVDTEMEALHRLAPTSDALERLLELCQVRHLDHQVEFAKAGRAKSQLAPRQAPA